MSASLFAQYTFLPWVQRGLARAIGNPDERGAALTARVSLLVGLRVDGAGDVTSSVRLYGPGDVTGLDAGQIIGSDPRPGMTSFEAGYMAQVRFARADLPWLFTPATPGVGGSRLRPWLVLVAVRRQDGVRLDHNPGGPLAVLEIAPPASAAAELPDLAQSWAWAHAQITGLSVGPTPAEILASDPGRACSRLICPRRLAPDTGYLACVVPAFLAGVKAGLGEPVEPADEAGLQPAWSATPAAGGLRLPVYHSWEFATGPEGSFETLVGRLEPRPLDPASARPPRLDLSAPGGGMPTFDPARPGAVVGLQSALRVPDRDAPRTPGADALPPWPEETRLPFQGALEGLLRAAPPDTITSRVPDMITAPVYGQVQARADALPSAGGQPAWLRECNLDPRLRVAAAAGTRVVQERQEQLMARAWEQAGAVQDTNALLRRAQLARELGGVLIERHLRPLSASDLLAVTQPAHARIVMPALPVDGQLRASRVPEATAPDTQARSVMSAQTVGAQLRESRVPEAAVSGAMRRLASPQGLIARRALRAAQPEPRVLRAAQPERRALRAARQAPFDILGAVERIATTPAPMAPVGMVAITVAQPPEGDARPAMPAGSVKIPLLERLAPETTVLERTRTRVDAPESTWRRTDPLAPVATGPRFAEPMYDGLQQVAPWLLLPGLEHVEADSVALLATTPRVIEAYMAGLNHELSRELLWREFPADLTATAFRQFWDVRGQPGEPEALADIAPIADWGNKPLGTNLRGGSGQLVLLIRGELLRRYPTTTIYAARANPDGTLDAASRRAPLFRGAIAPDIVFVGFALREQEALGTDPAGAGWYFVFEQYPGEPRFGFDDVAATTRPPQSPNDLAWAHLPVSPSGHVDVTRPLLSAAPDFPAVWGRDAAGMARLTFQQPFRLAMHASRLLPPQDGEP